MGVLGWQVYLALSQEEAADGEGGGSVIIIAIFLVAVGQFSPAGSAKGFRDVVAHASDTPVPLRRQSCELAV